MAYILQRINPNTTILLSPVMLALNEDVAVLRAAMVAVFVSCIREGAIEYHASRSQNTNGKWGKLN